MKIVMVLIVGLLFGIIACDAQEDEVKRETLPTTLNDELRALDKCYWYGGNKSVTKYKDPKISGHVTVEAVCVDNRVFIIYW